MANSERDQIIARDVAAIRTATFGRDVRSAIADGIEQCYTDVSTSKTLADNSVASANNAAALANQKAQDAQNAINGIDNKIDDIVLVQANQPSSPTNKLWVKPESEEYKVPTWEEFQEVANARPLIVDCGIITSLPKTFHADGITENHKPVKIELGTPIAVAGDVEISTGSGTITISGTINGSTTCIVTLAECTQIMANEVVTPALTTESGYVTSDGIEVNDGTWIRTGFVDISQALNCVVHIRSTLYNNAGTVWYNSNKDFIGSITGLNTNTYGVEPGLAVNYTLTLPSSAKYIRICGHASSINQEGGLKISYDINSHPN